MSGIVGNDLKQQVLEALSRCGLLRPGALLSEFTTFRAGGPADYLLTPFDRQGLRTAMTIAAEENLPLTVIGGGSNLLISDEGVRGLVIRLCEEEGLVSHGAVEEDGTLYADAWMKKRRFLERCLEESLEGMEFMAGIPGCLGGGIIMNAGTNMGTFADILERVEYLDSRGELKTAPIRKDMAKYRSLNLGEKAVITGGFFRLQPVKKIDLVRKKIEEIEAERKVKHPLDYPSAGSVFKNPEGHASWKLINDAGLKGRRLGGAMVSELHTNFIINVDKARSVDILNLIRLIQE